MQSTKLPSPNHMENAGSGGLRQRKGQTECNDKNSSTDSLDGEKAVKYMEALASHDMVPSSIRPYLLKMAPTCGIIVNLFAQLLPYLELGYTKLMNFWSLLEPYNPELLIPSFVGLIMCFFGGSFMTLIAALEAYKMCGYDSSLKCINDLKEDFNKFLVVNSKDDKEDLNNDGISDVLQVSSADLARRKTLLFLKTVDPKRVGEAITGLNSGFLAVAATLKLQFAKAITLGQAVGEVLEKPALLYGAPILRSVLPPDYQKWAKPIISYSIKSMAISFAWFLQRIISAFHSAIRGGFMCSRNILKYLSIMKIININHEDTYLDELAGYCLAFFGLMFQLSLGFGLPFPLNILLLPFRILEWFLMWAIN